MTTFIKDCPWEIELVISGGGKNGSRDYAEQERNANGIGGWGNGR
jgi:hypothetical protein